MENNITAGGVLLYDSNLNFFMIVSSRGYEDFGGKIDENDKDIYDCVAREAYEESNGIFNKSSIKRRIKKVKPIYNKKSKYLLFVIPMTKKEENISEKDFGKMEKYDKIKRNVELVPINKLLSSNFIKNQLFFRLKNKNILNFLFKLKK
jgi:hypothetical protein